MKSEDQKAAVSAYKERKIEGGIYAVRCLLSDQIWVGAAPDLSTIQNRLWFTLRHGSNAHRSLQDAWNVYGVDAFTFEVMERLEDEDIGYVRDRMMNDSLARWTDELEAVRI